MTIPQNIPFPVLLLLLPSRHGILSCVILAHHDFMRVNQCPSFSLLRLFPSKEIKLQNSIWYPLSYLFSLRTWRPPRNLNFVVKQFPSKPADPCSLLSSPWRETRSDQTIRKGKNGKQELLNSDLVTSFISNPTEGVEPSDSFVYLEKPTNLSALVYSVTR